MTRTDRIESHRRRAPWRRAAAPLSGFLPAGASLTLVAPQAGAAVAGPSAVAEDFPTGMGALSDMDDFTVTTR